MNRQGRKGRSPYSGNEYIKRWSRDNLFDKFGFRATYDDPSGREHHDGNGKYSRQGFWSMRWVKIGGFYQEFGQGKNWKCPGEDVRKSSYTITVRLILPRV